MANNMEKVVKGLGKYAVLISCTAYVCGAVSFQGSIMIMIAALALEWEEEVKINTMQVIVLDTVLYGAEKITAWASSLYRYLIGFMPYGDLHSLLNKINIFGLTNSLLDKIEVIVFIYLAFKAIKGGVVRIPWVTRFVQRALFDKINLANEVSRADKIISEKAMKVTKSTVNQAKAVKDDMSKAVNNVAQTKVSKKPLRGRQNDLNTKNSNSELDNSYDFSSFGSSSEEDILDD